MKVKIINKSGFDLPKYETEGAAGFDIRANIPNTQDAIIAPHERTLVPTGLYVEIPKGCELQIRPRSGIAYKHGITVINTPGTIDSDYRGEIKVALINNGLNNYILEHGQRIAQGVIAPIIQAEWEEVTELDSTERGEGGFGHTGK